VIFSVFVFVTIFAGSRNLRERKKKQPRLLRKLPKKLL